MRQADLADGFWFYERQLSGLGDYFRSCLIADIEALAYYAGIHETVYGYHRSLSKTFPFAIYYRVDDDAVTVVAVLTLDAVHLGLGNVSSSLQAIRSKALISQAYKP